MIGSPPACRPECISNHECSQDLACMNKKCKDPCLNACPQSSECHVRNHLANCECPPGYTGNAFDYCSKIPERDVIPDDPCQKCGKNSLCRNGQCQCPPDYFGDPYTFCKPECITSNDCSSTKACVRLKCVDPCVNICSPTAICTVQNHVPSCSCPEGMVGDPFTNCRVEYRDPPRPSDPCQPNRCGPFSLCRDNGNGQAICTCMENMIGSPPNCKPQCITNSECELSKACKNRRCVDPCLETRCGIRASCRVVSHSPVCECDKGYYGDPFYRCEEDKIEDEPVRENVCERCGPFSLCREISGTFVCKCLEGYIGAPPNCRPQCLVNSDCSNSLACNNMKCVDPCSNACGFNAR
jgi:hypothetical protein